VIPIKPTLIGRLVLRQSVPDPAAAKRAAGPLLSGAWLRPRGLSTSSVLVIRSLADPLPGLVALDSLTPLPQRWEHAVAERVAEAAGTAARPAVEHVPATSNAVLFADRAELLACLASDWINGRAWTRWWWKEVITGAGGAGAIAHMWRSEPRYVPAAMEILAHRGEAIAFAEALSPSAATAIREAVAEAFGIAHVPPQPPGDTGPSKQDTTEHARQQEWPEVARGAWLDAIPEAGHGLHPDQQLLVGLSLALRRNPDVLRTASHRRFLRGVPRKPPEPFPRRLDRSKPGGGSRESTSFDRSGEVVGPSEPDAQGTGQPSDLPARAVGGRPVTGPSIPRDSPRVPESPAHLGRVAAEAVDAPKAPPGGAPPTSVVPDAGRHGPQPWSRPSAQSPPLPNSSSTESGGEVPRVAGGTSSLAPPGEEVPRPDEVVDTTLGGLFYLLNIALYLGLYGDFTSPKEPGIALDVWDFLVLLGKELLGRPHPADPVWGLLARLARRRGSQPPGRSFAPPPVWRVPAEWLEPIPATGAWAWSAASGRLRLDHPGGFPVLDVARTHESARAQLDRECREAGLAPGVLVRRSVPRLPARPLRRWVVALARYLRARLASALGEPAEVAVELLLRHRARVFVTPVHVDIALSLEALPIEIRLAGLDRDPGWIPATGRIVAFHFD
jgi:hypothetical protein